MTVSASFRTLGPFRELKEKINDRCSTRAINKHNLFYQLMTLWLKAWLLAVADECHMNPDVKKWKSISEGHDYFAMLEDWLFILKRFPSM